MVADVVAAGAPFADVTPAGARIEVRQRGNPVSRDPDGDLLNPAGNSYGPVRIHEPVAVRVRNTGSQPIRIAIAVDWT
jgi:hypothetical protein